MVFSLVTPSVRASENWASAKKKYEQSDKSEAARQAYVNTLAAALGREVADHMAGKSGDEARSKRIFAIDAELRLHPAPSNADSKAESALRVGKWQSPRHAYIFRADGAWRFAPEDGSTGGRWRIEHNRYFEDDRPYTILVSNREFFVYSDAQDVFYEYRVGK
jgi:hypothetical protein